MTVYCADCGFQNHEGSRYCTRCGLLIVMEEVAGQMTEGIPTIDLPGSPDRIHGPALVVRTGGGRAGDHLALQATRHTIGRRVDSDLFLDDVTVSRDHAIVELAADGRYITDRGSLNGTYVNRVRVTRHRLAEGDEVQIGKFKLIYLER